MICRHILFLSLSFVLTVFLTNAENPCLTNCEALPPAVIPVPKVAVINIARFSPSYDSHIIKAWDFLKVRAPQLGGYADVCIFIFPFATLPL